MNEQKPNYDPRIPEKFYKSPEKQVGEVKTLGALKKLLAELPDDLPLNSSPSSPGLIPMVFNCGQSTVHLSFEEADDWMDDDDFDDDLGLQFEDDDEDDEDED